MSWRKILPKYIALMSVLLIISIFIPKEVTAASVEKPKITVKNEEEGTLKIEWNTVPGATYFDLYRAVDVSGTPGTFKELARYHYEGNDFEEYYDSEIKIGKTYHYKIVVVSSENETLVESKTVKGIPTLGKPMISSTWHDASTGSPVIQWEDNGRPDRFQVWRSTSKTGTYKHIYTTTKSKYKDAKTTLGTTYYYKIVAVWDANYNGNSVYSNIVSVKKIKGDTKLAAAINNTVNNGKVVKVTSLDDTLKQVSKLNITSLSAHDGGNIGVVEGKLNVNEIFDSSKIKNAGGTVYKTTMGAGGPCYGELVVYVKKNGYKYEQFLLKTYGMNILKVRKGSSASEINTLIKETARKYYPEKYWTVTAEKYAPSTKNYSGEVKALKSFYDEYLGKTSYAKYKSNRYMIKIKNKNNSKRQGWAFITVVPTLERISAPRVTVSNLKSTDDIKISWKKISNADKYEVWRKAGSSGTYKKIITTTKISYTDKKTSVGKKYYYKVKAIKSSNCTQNSNFSNYKYIKCN